MESLTKQPVLTIFVSALLIVSIALHTSAFEITLSKYVKTYTLFFASLLSVGLEALMIYLFFKRSKFAYAIKLIISGVIFISALPASFNLAELQSLNELRNNIDFKRLLLGVIPFVSLIALAYQLRYALSQSKRQDLKHIPAKHRLEIAWQLFRVKARVKIDPNDKLNFKLLCKTYNIKSSSFEKYLIRKGMFSSKFFKQMPAKRSKKKENQVSSGTEPKEPIGAGIQAGTGA